MLSTSTSCGGAERIYRRHPTYQLAQLGSPRSIYRMYQERCVRRQILSPEESRIDSSAANISFCYTALHVPFRNVERLDRNVQLNFRVVVRRSFSDDYEFKYEDSVVRIRCMNSNYYLRVSFVARTI